MEKKYIKLYVLLFYFILFLFNKMEINLIKKFNKFHLTNFRILRNLDLFKYLLFYKYSTKYENT